MKGCFHNILGISRVKGLLMLVKLFWAYFSSFILCTWSHIAVTLHWPETPSCMFRRKQYCLLFLHWSTQTLCYCTAMCAAVSKCRRSVVVVSMWNRLEGASVFICQQLAQQLKLSPRFNPKHLWTLHLRPDLNRLGFFARLVGKVSNEAQKVSKYNQEWIR